MSGRSLSVRKLRLTLPGRVLHHDISFDLPASGLICLMGPMGIGKSTLLAWLCGQTDPSIVTARAERVEMAGAPVGDGNRPVLLPQRAITSGDDAIVRLSHLLSLNAAVLCVDEPTAGLSPEDAAKVLDILAKVARDRTVLMVTHNQLQAASFADQVMLLAAGTLQEITPAKRFFTAPTSEAGRQFIRTGGVSLAAPDTDQRLLHPALRGVPEALDLQDEGTADPLLRWVIRDRLALYTASDAWPFSAHRLRELAQKGITALALFDSASTADRATVARSGLASLQLRVGGPERPAVADCRLNSLAMDRLLASGHCLAVALTAGSDPVARTVGAQLVRMGMPAGRAADALRRILRESPLSVEDEQLLWDLELAFDLDATGAPGNDMEDGAVVQLTSRFALGARAS
jgi:ABC-type phosphate transport system ATPase subunit